MCWLSVVITGIVPFDRLSVPDPIALGVDVIGMGWLSTVVKFGAILGLSSVMLVLLLGQSRVLYSIRAGRVAAAGRGEGPSAVPHALADDNVYGAIVAILSGLLPIGLVGELVSMALCSHLPCLLGVLVLQVTHPEINRPFRAPLIAVVAPLGAAFRRLSDARPSWRHMDPLRGMAGAWACDLYFYGRKHSRLRQRGGGYALGRRVREPAQAVERALQNDMLRPFYRRLRRFWPGRRPARSASG